MLKRQTATVLLMFEESLDLKISELWKLKNVRDEIFASKNYFRAIQNLLPACDSQTSVLQNTKLVLDIIIQDISRWTIKKEVLNHFNHYFNCLSETERFNVTNSRKISNIYYLCKLVDLLGAYGDYDFQVLLLKTIITAFKIDKSLTETLIPESVDLQIKFLNITIENFDCTVRDFLNKLNQQSGERKIFSIQCQSITLGSIKYMEINNNMWIDFNLIDKIASWYSTVETSSEDCKIGQEKSNSCNLILLFETHVDKVTIKRNLCKTLTIIFKLNSSCVSYIEKDQYLLKNKRTLQIQVDYSPQAEYLISTILPTLYRNKYEHKSCKRKLLQKPNPYLKTPRRALSNDEIVNISSSSDCMSDLNSYLERISLEKIPIDTTNLNKDLDSFYLVPEDDMDFKLKQEQILKSENECKGVLSRLLNYTPTDSMSDLNPYLERISLEKMPIDTTNLNKDLDRKKILKNRDLNTAKTSKSDDFAIDTRSEGDPEDDMDFKLKQEQILKSENECKGVLSRLLNYTHTETKDPKYVEALHGHETGRLYASRMFNTSSNKPGGNKFVKITCDVEQDELPITNYPKIKDSDIIRKTRKNKPVPENSVTSQRTRDKKFKKRKRQDSECSNKTEMSSIHATNKTASRKDKNKPRSDKNTKKTDRAFLTKVKNDEHKKENKSVSTNGRRKITERNYKISALNVPREKKPKKSFENKNNKFKNESKRRDSRFDCILRTTTESNEDVSFHQTLTQPVKPETPPPTVVNEMEIPAIVPHPTPLFIEPGKPRPVPLCSSPGNEQNAHKSNLYAKTPLPECTLNDSNGNQEISQTEENKQIIKPSGGNNIPLPTANIWTNNAIVGNTQVTLFRKDFVGKYIFIIVYNFDISVCESKYSEMIELNERIEEFNEIGADILICTKGPNINVLEWANKFKNQELLRNLKIRIINDFDGQFMSKNFQVFLENVHYEIKTRLIISDQGDVVHKSIFSTLDDINVDRSLKLLRLMQIKLAMT